MMSYNFKHIEKKWQKYWSENQTFKAENKTDLPKYFIMDMFPYPSGAGLHVGHPLGYIASDIFSRYKRLKGFNVLHPQGYDSFGLPAEQYAIQTGRHPKKTTDENIARYREQLDRLGFSFDWSREIRTSDKSYYKWTQWMFIKLYNSWYDNKTETAKDINELILIFSKEGNTNLDACQTEEFKTFSSDDWNSFEESKKNKILLNYRLAFLSEIDVNWCPKLGTVLANDEIIDGLSERGGFEVIRKKMTQWSIRISAYSQRLLTGLNDINWPEPLKEMQKNWIGRSDGAMVTFDIENFDKQIEFFTTRVDTIFGVTFMTLAPEHPYVKKITTKENLKKVQDYIKLSEKKKERERMSDVKSITGVFTGAYAIHPLSNERLPIWISDYVLAGYGTGAVMAVPCGDQRDYDFAKHFDLPIPNIFKNVDISQEAFTQKEGAVIDHSDFLSGLPYKEALHKSILALEALGSGYGKVNYRLRDAVFSRQRYWGEPFPIYYNNGVPVLIDKAHLPIQLPEVAKYLPTETGAPPLGNATHWAWCTKTHQVVSNQAIDQKTVFPLELNTMPGWAGSSFYFNRYKDATNSVEMASKEALDYWGEVDLYIGGSEHATGHLLYARFWQKALYDLGVLPEAEFAKKLINQGMITGTSAFVYRLPDTNTYVSKSRINGRSVQPIHVDVSMVNVSDELDIDAFKAWRPEYAAATFELEDKGVYKVGREVEKMSKSKYNVVSPDAICEQYGADSLRLYEMFLGPLEQSKPWNTAGITGTHGFLKNLWRLYFNENGPVFKAEPPSAAELKILHKTIKKVTEDIENFSFNTSVSTFMICVNELAALNCTSQEILEALAILVSPYAPHIAEELWEAMGHEASISTAPFPVFNPAYLVESEKEYPVSFNGKMRFKLTLPMDMSKQEIEAAVMAHEKTLQQLDTLSQIPPNKLD